MAVNLLLILSVLLNILYFTQTGGLPEINLESLGL